MGCTNDPYPKGHADDKVLYSVFDEAPKTLDPAVAYTTVEHDVTGSVFDTLVEYHYLKRPYELIPGLAEAIPEPENLPDGKVRYQFKLRPGLLFQNDLCFELGGKGRRTRQITSKDFAFELKRIADPAVNSPVIESFGAIDGFVEFSKRLTERRKSDKAFAALPTHEQYERVGELSGVKSNDDLLLEIVLTKPYPQILYWFAMPFASPLPWRRSSTTTVRRGAIRSPITPSPPDRTSSQVRQAASDRAREEPELVRRAAPGVEGARRDVPE